MGNLIYAMNVSLDGFVETTDQSLEWATVDEELHSWFNDRTREIDASIYGGNMYRLMAAYWPTADSDPSATPVEVEFAQIWRPLPKIVFSTTLTSVDWNSRLVSGDVGDELDRLRQEFSGDLDLGGARLAAEFIKRDLVDEYRLLVHPVVIGDGTPFFPSLAKPLALRLTDTRHFDSGVLYMRYERA